MASGCETPKDNLEGTDCTRAANVRLTWSDGSVSDHCRNHAVKEVRSLLWQPGKKGKTVVVTNRHGS